MERHYDLVKKTLHHKEVSILYAHSQNWYDTGKKMVTGFLKRESDSKIVWKNKWKP